MNQQRGSTLVGFIIGLVVGLAVALGVAVYVTKVPMPFMNKGQTRSADQDAAEAEKNKDWDPNAPLYGKKGSKSGDKTDEPKTEPKPDAAVKVDPKSADPLGDLVKSKTAEPKPEAKAKPEVKTPEAKPAETKAPEPKAAEPTAEAKAAIADPFIYFVQAGAYRSNEEAQAQRAKTALLGLDAKISERDQGGRTVYRVRVGPLDKVEAERVRAKLEAAHIDSAMVRVQR
ncbi:SPOR domain-containing protein [Limnohabitans sp. TEGF004]|jgi:cell division protein FtsN|uniref:SPOR domain-containing protein n=1 Tax=Limnohabitans sp. TEGF004 TaxID=2986281 RepID=UPI00248F69B8|nr:SPOR domain-containing protein [Limnohabitans sp. TEGF004]